MPKIQRLTIFKIPDEGEVEQALEAYKKLAAEHKKDGAPYIKLCSAYKLYGDERSQGYTLAARTVFSSLEDMKYYDTECAAHSDLKKTVVPFVKGGPPLTIYMDFE